MLNCSRSQLASCIVVTGIIFAIFSPYIFDFDGGREDYNNSTQGDEIRNNLLLKGADLIAIGSSMPLMSTLCLDMMWPIFTSYRWYESASLIVFTVSPMVCHLVASNYHWGPHFSLSVNTFTGVLWAWLGFNSMWKTISHLSIWTKSAMIISPLMFFLGLAMRRASLYIAGLAMMVLCGGIGVYGVVLFTLERDLLAPLRF